MNIMHIAKSFAGRRLGKDELEATVAASLYVAAAEGGIDAGELDQLRVSLAGNEGLKAFQPAQINEVVARFRGMIEEGPRAARLRIVKECQDVKDPSKRELIFASVLDVADQGGIAPAEMDRVHDVAKWLNVNPGDFGV